MNSKKIITQCIEHAKNCLVPTDIGSLVESIDDDTAVIATADKAIKKVLVFSKNNKVIRINFIFNKEELSIKDMVDNFGEIQSGYSFRDNITKFRISIIDDKLNSVIVKINDNVEVNNSEISIKTPKGIVTTKKIEDKIFKSIMFEMI